MKPKRAPLQQLNLKKGIANNGKIDIAKLCNLKSTRFASTMNEAIKRRISLPFL
jgi:hypothetical protein